MGKILLIVSLVFTLATAALGFLNKGKLDTKTGELATTSDSLAKTKADLTKTSGELKTAQGNVTTLTTEKEQAIAQATAAQSDAEKAKADVTKLTSEKTDLTAKVTQLQSDLDAANQKVAAGTTPTTDNSTEINDLKAQIEEKNTLLTGVQQQLESATQNLKVLQDEKQARLTKSAAKSLEGQILAVNPQWNFVVLNLGDKNGVVSNTELLVKRGNQLVGKVRVTSVEPSTSIADIVSKSVPAGTSIAPGDNVIFQAQSLE